MNHTKQPSLQGIYFISLAATIIGIGVIIILDLATPLAYMQGRLSSLDQSRVQQLARLPGGTVNLAFLLLLSCPLLLVGLQHYSDKGSNFKIQHSLKPHMKLHINCLTRRRKARKGKHLKC
jgi:hypothetical protein